MGAQIKRLGRPVSAQAFYGAPPTALLGSRSNPHVIEDEEEANEMDNNPIDNQHDTISMNLDAEIDELEVGEIRLSGTKSIPWSPDDPGGFLVTL